MKTRKSLTLFDDYHAMMADPVRMGAYQRAIEAVVRPGDVVIDLGSGLGILSLMALRAGASRVIAIEKGDAIHLAQAVARRNGVEDRIEFVQANSKDYEPTELADVLISETLGSFGVEENTLDFTIDARDRLLKPGGRMVPQRLFLALVPVEHPEGREKADFWADVQGFDFSAARDESLARMSVARFKVEQAMAEPVLYADIDLQTVTSPKLEGTHMFPLLRKGRVDGLCGWFGAELTDDVLFWTSPNDTPTHWKQAFFPFHEAPEVVMGDYLQVFFEVNPESSHSDNSSITYEFRCTQLANE